MTSSYVAFIDESGDEGFSFCGHNNSSAWFAMSAVVMRHDAEVEMVRLWRGVREHLGKAPGYTLHFRELKHEQKVVVAQRIACGRFRTISILCHKPSLNETEYLRRKPTLYFYLSRFLFERISWLCREKRLPDDGDGSASIVFSNRSSMSYEDIKEYMHRLRQQSQARNIQIDWGVIQPDKISAVPHRLKDGLQVADAVCSGMWKAFEPDHYGNTEHRYARETMRVVYRGNRKAIGFGYGVKLWPTEVLTRIRAHGDYGWLFKSRRNRKDRSRARGSQPTSGLPAYRRPLVVPALTCLSN